MNEAVNDPVVSVSGLTFWRGERKILDNISFTINRGEIVAVMGPSGTGKTTLIRLLTGQLKPNSGEIRVFGELLSALSRNALMKLRQRISMLFQNNALFSDMTVGENVAFPLREILNLPAVLIDILVLLKLQTVGLRGAVNLMPSELSGGMARRAALARAIAMDPEIMIYDEPFTGQDPITLGILTKLVKDINRGLRMTSLVITHNIAEACQIADKILLLSMGKVVALDTPEALMQSDDPLIAQFMNGHADGPVAFHYPADDYVATLCRGEKSDDG